MNGKYCIDCINHALDDFCDLHETYVDADDTCDDWQGNPFDE